jgi:hypothetical protein
MVESTELIPEPSFEAPYHQVAPSILVQYGRTVQYSTVQRCITVHYGDNGQHCASKAWCVGIRVSWRVLKLESTRVGTG